MTEIIVNCPGCNRKFKIKGTEASFTTQNFTCPRCGYSAPFNVVFEWAKITSGNICGTSPQKVNVINKPASNSIKTTVANQCRGVPAIYTTDKHLIRQLKPGTFVLGRQSSDSQSDIRIAPDPYMSRSHALLTVVPRIDGNGMTCSIKAIKRESPVIVNNTPLRYGDIVILQSGDNITLGKTTITFCIR